MLRKTKVRIESLDKEVELIELSYLGQMEVMEAYSSGQSAMAGPIMIKHGAPEFSEMTPEDIGSQYPLSVIVELTDAITEFSGLGEDQEKKSESAPA